MTIDEAIKEIKRWTGILLSSGSQCSCKTAEAQDMAIKVLEEARQYRVIGTPEECRAAVERQMARTPIYRNMESGIFRKRKIFICPRCGNACLEMMMNERQNTNYCWDCGQKLDWSDEE